MIEPTDKDKAEAQRLLALDDPLSQAASHMVMLVAYGIAAAGEELKALKDHLRAEHPEVAKELELDDE